MGQVGIGSQGMLAPHTHLSIPDGGIIYKDGLPSRNFAHAWLNGNQVIPTGVLTKILYNAELFDISGDFTADGVASSFLVPATDYYEIFAQTCWQAVSLVRILHAIIVNGANVGGRYDDPRDDRRGNCVFTKQFLTIGDVIDIRVEQNSGGNETIDGLVDRTFVIIRRL